MSSLSAEDADEVISEVADVVGDLEEDDEQTAENIELIAVVFEKIDSLIREEGLDVDESVCYREGTQ